ncbi:hypothetical protein SAMN05518672_10441 [Chitinophaga sp. CF118]|uniref:hypothetical protein n=1 Tax=Chitinophaga sp. CF118 TaxID=1884367 RepID=UPI0008F0005B|nr:hypothetical protein [Chitinophaga sp. CF118]SFD98553.1 hypothetical protein SAMN05518672_10441 [Chitinophaga sp. CF118]
MRLPLICLLSLLSFTSCITSSVVQTAKYDRQPQKVREIKDASIDSSGCLLINFTARLSWNQQKAPLHIRIPADSLLHMYVTNSQLTYYPADNQKYAGITKLHRVLSNPADKLGYGVIAELTDKAVQRGFASPTYKDSINGKLQLPVSLYDYHFSDENGNSYKHSRLVLLYIPKQQLYQTNMKTDYLVIALPPSRKRTYWRYGLTPFSATADAITLPFQGLVALVAYYMRS